jgi:hypothetical protein
MESVIIIDSIGMGHPMFSKSWVNIDIPLLSGDFNPGKPFRIWCGNTGVLKIVGSHMENSESGLIPIMEGLNPFVCSKVLQDVGNTASNIWALY